MSSKRIATILFSCYVVASAGYIGYRMWQDFVNRYSTQAYAQGKAETIQAIVSQASDGSCKPVTVFNSSKQVELIDVACLASATDATTNLNTKTK